MRASRRASGLRNGASAVSSRRRPRTHGPPRDGWTPATVALLYDDAPADARSRPKPRVGGSLGLPGGRKAGETEETPAVKSVCPHDCPSACALVVTVADGRAVDVT